MPSADVMYIEDAMEALVSTLLAVTGPQSEVYVAHGRCGQSNRHLVVPCCASQSTGEHCTQVSETPLT